MEGRMAGYSTTALANKLGVKAGYKIHAINPPPNYRTLLKPLPAAVTFALAADSSINIVHMFETERVALARVLAVLRKKLSPDATIWVSWPKKASKVHTDITENSIREVAIPLGFVDIKVCAVTEIWSGLKLVVRKEFR
jgi:hypothetical protein